MAKISCKVQENVLRRYFVKDFLAAVLRAAGAARHFPALFPSHYHCITL
jgi:hypothetical protein